MTGADRASLAKTLRRPLFVIPAGVFHGYSHIEDSISYLSIRVDPDQVLPAGYVNPLLETQ